MLGFQSRSKREVVAAKQLGLIFGVILAFMLCTGLAYYWAWHNVWNSFQTAPAIGAEPLKIKLVTVVSDIPAGAEITTNSVDERYETTKHVALDAFGFASECLGRKTKWAMKKGEYIAKHDLLPQY